MRFLLVLVAIAAAAWSGYWVIGARALDRGAEAARAAAEARGLIARYDVEVRGFPNRFDLTLRDVALGDPRQGLGWSAPFFQIFALGYRPHHVIAVWPTEQRLTIAGVDLPVTAADMRASVVLRPEGALPLDRAVFVAEAVEAGPPGAGLAADSLRVALRAANGVEGGDASGDPDDDAGAAYDLAVEATPLRLPAAMMAALRAGPSPGLSMPGDVGLVRLDATLTLDRPLDRFLGDGRPPALRAITLHEARIAWGDLTIIARGRIDVGRDGVPTGRIDTETEGWRALPPLAVLAGLVRAEVAPTVATALETLATARAPSSTLHLPLVLDRGRMSFGPIPLGPAPRLR